MKTKSHLTHCLTQCLSSVLLTNCLPICQCIHRQVRRTHIDSMESNCQVKFSSALDIIWISGNISRIFFCSRYTYFFCGFSDAHKFGVELSVNIFFFIKGYIYIICILKCISVLLLDDNSLIWCIFVEWNRQFDLFKAFRSKIIANLYSPSM